MKNVINLDAYRVSKGAVGMCVLSYLKNGTRVAATTMRVAANAVMDTHQVHRMAFPGCQLVRTKSGVVFIGLPERGSLGGA